MTKNVDGRPRQSTHINRRVAQSVFRGFDFATDTGRPLNRYIVIHLNETDAACAATIFERIRHRFRDWLTYQTKKLGVACPPLYVYACENPTNQRPHVNWAVHVPEALQAQFDKKLSRWVERSQESRGPFDIDAQPIVPSHAKRLAKYILKGIDPDFIEHFHLETQVEKYGPQGTYYGKRAGTSPALGPAVRKSLGYRPNRKRSAVNSDRVVRANQLSAGV